MGTKIIVVDEHKILREGLSTLIAKQPDMEIIGEATDGREALELIEKLMPDLILMDVTMPNLNGIEATRKIKSKNPNIEIIALSLHSDRRYVLGMIDALEVLARQPKPFGALRAHRNHDRLHTYRAQVLQIEIALLTNGYVPVIMDLGHCQNLAELLA